MPFSIKVRSPQGDHVIECQDDWTVLDLKKKLAAGTVDVGDDTNRMKLIFMARVMKDEQKLKEVGVKEEHTVHLVIKAPEAPAPPPGATAGAGTSSSSSSSAGPQAGAANSGQQQSFQQSFNFTAGGAGSGAGGGQQGFMSPEMMQGLQGLMGQLNPMLAGLAGGMGNVFQGQQGAGAGMGARANSAPTGGSPTAGASSPPQPGASPTGSNNGASASAASAAPRTASPPAPPQSPPQAGSTGTAQQPQQPAAAGVPVPVHPVAGFHVHVHVTMDELERLPERLENFSRRMPPPQQPTLHIHRQAAAGPGGVGVDIRSAMSNLQSNLGSVAGAAQNAATNAAARVAMGVATGVASARGGAPSAQQNLRPGHPPHYEQHSGQQQQQQQQAATGTAAAAPEASNPRQSIAQMARQAGIPDEKSDSIFDELANQLCNALDMSDMMKLFAGDWSPAQKARPPLKDFILKELDGEVTEQTKLALAHETAVKLVKTASDSDEFRRNIMPRQKENRNILFNIEAVVREAAFRLINLTLDESSGPNTFAQGLRPLLVRHTGMTLDYAERVVFRNGRADTDEVLKWGIGKALQKAVEQFPDFQGMAAMGGPMFANFARNWQHEYTVQRGSEMEDDAIMESSAPANLPPLRKKSKEEKHQDPDDDLLDAALDECAAAPAAPATTSSSAAASASNAEKLTKALQEAGVGLEDLKRTVEPVERDEKGTGAAFSHFEPGEPRILSEQYKALYQKGGAQDGEKK